MLEIRALNKSFFNGPVKYEAVRDLNLTIQKGEFFSLLGPSGCGKTTLLRMIAGLESATSGEILLAGEKIQNWPAQKRPFHMVFQKHALFPHLSVFDNVAFGLKLKKINPTEIAARVEDALKLVHMTGFESRRPETLSGGQSQRVAIARALVNRPQVLLLDEPLSALDRKLREHMQRELKDLQKTLGLTFIYVTHDQEEALVLSDRIGVMNQGKLEQVSSGLELYQNPQSAFAAQFVGSMAYLKVQKLKEDSQYTTVHAGHAVLKARKNSQVDDWGFLFIRPENIELHSDSSSSSDNGPHQENQIDVIIDEVIFRGSDAEYQVRLSDQQKLRIFSKFNNQLKQGHSASISFRASDCFLFKELQ